MTEPAVGASVCASGSHVWNGNIGTLTANATPKARNIHSWVVDDRLRAIICRKSNEVIVPRASPAVIAM